ncbi:D-alanyl-D-alanine carboxypeptidase/D-alanyl-D-alanine endopeptidase [Desulfosoma caldarium]|uniref:D-alanyl-D-alanine carboxypeptidase/D-alanyl-D-alanine endopeptidase n=1 Tax=Desulfosoma caldarium TaxID=610254 RepID=UPI0014750F40|nr:D-alanyl-D-alanine carboxypeptidase/D-alanyl-D-alanine-endopeptidase [Desulfosoma caldarium]
MTETKSTKARASKASTWAEHRQAMRAVCDDLSVQVVALPSGTILWENQAHKPLVPASLTKLLTSYAALKVLGPDYRFRTEIWAECKPVQGVVSGSLWIKGYGDPFLIPERIWILAQKVRSQGIEKVLGGIYVDDSAFDPPLEHLCLDNRCDRPHNPLISATAFNNNTVSVEIVPGKAGPAAPNLRTFPPTDYVVFCQAWQAQAKNPRVGLESLGVGDDGRETFRVYGKKPGEAFLPAEYRMNIQDPQRFAALTFRRALKDAGTEVQSADAGSRPLPPQAFLVYRFESPPLSDVLYGLNRYSNNFMAEMMLRVLGFHVYGPPGSLAKGCRAVENVLVGLGIPTAEAILDSGSGLTRSTRVSAATFNAVLMAAHRDWGVGPEFLASLARSGEEGTLRKRMKACAADYTIRGKTGTLKDVVSFSGYIGNLFGTAYAVTVIMNGVAAPWKAREALDAFVTDIPRLAAAKGP